jgi:hypothetical protein
MRIIFATQVTNRDKAEALNRTKAWHRLVSYFDLTNGGEDSLKTFVATGLPTDRSTVHEDQSQAASGRSRNRRPGHFC